METAQIFRKVYNGHRNFITPDRLAFGEAAGGRLQWELSEGTGFEPGTLTLGLTIIELDGPRARERWDLSHCVATGLRYQTREYYAAIDEAKREAAAMEYSPMSGTQSKWVTV